MVYETRREVSYCQRKSGRRLDEPGCLVQADTRQQYVDTNRRPALRPAFSGKAHTSTVDREQAVRPPVPCAPTDRPRPRDSGRPLVGKCRVWRSCRWRTLWPRATPIEGAEPLPRPPNRPSRCHRQQTLRPCRAQKTVPTRGVCHPPPCRANLAMHDDASSATTNDGGRQPGAPSGGVWPGVAQPEAGVGACAQRDCVGGAPVGTSTVQRTRWAARQIFLLLGCGVGRCPIKCTNLGNWQYLGGTSLLGLGVFR